MFAFDKSAQEARVSCQQCRAHDKIFDTKTEAEKKEVEVSCDGAIFGGGTVNGVPED